MIKKQVEEIKNTVDLKKLKNRLIKFISYYNKNPRQIGNEVVIDFSEEPEDVGKLLLNADKERVKEVLEILEAEAKNQVFEEYKLSTVNLDFTYSENKTAIEEFFKMIENGADLRSAEFDIVVGKEMFISIVDHYNKTYYEIKFKGEDYNEAFLIRDRLKKARKTRRENLFKYLALDYGDTDPQPGITDKNILKNMKVEIKKRFPDEVIQYKNAEDWLHFNKDGFKEHPFFLKDLTLHNRVDGQIVMFKYNESAGECHMKFFYIGSGNFYMPEIKFPVTEDDIEWLKRLILNIDCLRDENIFYIIKEETQMIYYDFSKD